MEELKKSGPHPYPHKFSVSVSLTDFIDRYSHLECGQQVEEDVMNIAGEYMCHS